MGELIDREPWILETIRHRKTIFMKERGPVREAALDFAEMVAVILRSPEFWASLVAFDIAGGVYGGLKSRIVRLFGLG